MASSSPPANASLTPLTPNRLNQALTQVDKRNGRSPNANQTQGKQHVTYTSFPTLDQMERDRAAAAAASGSLDRPKDATSPKAPRRSLCNAFLTFIQQWRQSKAEHDAEKLAEKEAKLAAAVEEEQATAAAIERNKDRSSKSFLTFGSLHLSLAPPIVCFRKEELNPIGYDVTPRTKQSPTGPTSTVEEYRSNGDSYESDTPTRNVIEKVITLRSSIVMAQPTSNKLYQPPSPTVTSMTLTDSDERHDSITPTSKTFCGTGSTPIESPLSNISLTPPQTIQPPTRWNRHTIESRDTNDKYSTPTSIYSPPAHHKRILHGVSKFHLDTTQALEAETRCSMVSP